MNMDKNLSARLVAVRFHSLAMIPAHPPNVANQKKKRLPGLTRTTL